MGEKDNMYGCGDSGFYDCVAQLLEHEAVQSMGRYCQHGDVDCLAHCLRVSYRSYRICKGLGLDYRSAARGGLLHDFFLYDWHKENPYGGLHGFRHPKVAAQNAQHYFTLGDKERDVIKKHMWPLTPVPPKYAEALVVALVDKYCCVLESAAGIRAWLQKRRTRLRAARRPA